MKKPPDVTTDIMDKHYVVRELDKETLSKIARGEDFYRKLEEPIVGDTIFIATDIRDLNISTVINLISHNKLYY